MTAPGGSGETMRIDAPGGAGLSMTMVAAQPFEARVGSFTPDDAEDWEHLDPPGRRAHDRLAVRSRGAAFESIAVLVPTGPGEVPPRVRAVPAEGGVAVVVDHGEVQDVLLLATGGSRSVSAEGAAVDGWFGMERRSGAGPVLASARVDRAGRATVAAG